MSSLLKDVMEDRATQVDAHGIDAAALLLAGKGRIRRRRAATAVAVTACAAVVATGLSGVLLGDGGRTEGVAPAVPTGRVTMAYSTGSTIVLGDASYDAGGEVMSFVRTDSATVFTTTDGTIRVLADSGPAREIGSTSKDGYYLTSDPDADMVAWVEWPAGASPEFVVYDVAAGREVWRDSTGTTRGMKAYADDQGVAYVYALDEGVLYLRDSRGAVAVDLSTEEAEVLRPDAHMRTVADADGGVVAWDSPNDNDGLVVGTSYGEGAATRRTSTPLLSPGGTHLSTEDGDEFLIQRTSDAADVSPTLPRGYTFAAAYGWADDDTVLVFGYTDPLTGSSTHDVDFLACSVADGSCTKVGSDRIDQDHFSLPIGQQLGG